MARQSMTSFKQMLLSKVAFLVKLGTFLVCFMAVFIAFESEISQLVHIMLASSFCLA